MYAENLELLLTHVATRRLCAAAGPAQSEFTPDAAKWSIARRIFVQLIDLQKSGLRTLLTLGFPSIAYLPKTLLPALEAPLTIFKMSVAKLAREAMLEFRILPARNPDKGTPRKDKPVREPLNALSASFAETGAVFYENPNLDYRELRYRHPLQDDNNALDSLRIAALHERRHQSQVRVILRSGQFLSVA